MEHKSKNTGQLITAGELHARLNDDDWRVVDCRFDLGDVGAGRNAYQQGHIPGAVFADLNADLASPPTASSGRHPLPDPAVAAASFGNMGIDVNTKVVVYDGGNGAMAARAWWVLRWLGLEQVRLLNGGIAAWAEAGYPVSSATVEIVARNFQAMIRDERVVTTAELQDESVSIAALNLLDARDKGRFDGEHEPIDPVAGHVPGALNMPFTRSIDHDGRWRDERELDALWREHLGDDKAVESVAMCGSGVTACHLILSALQAGYREPRLYVGSWSEWIADSRRPVARSEDGLITK